MECTCGHIHNYAKVDVKRYDPTRTTQLRTAFTKDINRRFVALARVVKKAVLDEDCFGLVRSTLKFNALEPPRNRAFAFSKSSDKVEAFMKWLRDQEKKGLLQTIVIPTQGMTEVPWSNIYIQDSYKRGVIRAQYEMKKAGIKIPNTDFQYSMGTPFHVDRVAMLYTRAFEELKGITSVMDTQISRVLGQGLVDGDNPRVLARKMISVLDGKGLDISVTDTLGRFIPAMRRAQTLARTEIIRAHHHANINEYERWGVEGVEVLAEWQTAGYNVCPDCASLQGQIFTIAQIRNMIPRHPNCRCMALPTLKK